MYLVSKMVSEACILEKEFDKTESDIKIYWTQQTMAELKAFSCMCWHIICSDMISSDHVHVVYIKPNLNNTQTPPSNM